MVGDRLPVRSSSSSRRLTPGSKVFLLLFLFLRFQILKKPERKTRIPTSRNDFGLCIPTPCTLRDRKKIIVAQPPETKMTNGRQVAGWRSGGVVTQYPGTPSGCQETEKTKIVVLLRPET